MAPPAIDRDVPTPPNGSSPFVLQSDPHNSCSPHINGYSHKKEEALPIAIIGYSLKFPQEATSSEAFWQMLVEGRSARSEIPGDRFNVEAFYHPDSSRHESMNIRGAHFLKDNIAAFDAPFFSINPAEAASMDPQQRGLLETAYRAFENAGITLEEAAGSKTSVHIGSFTHDWTDILRRDPLMDISYQATGSEFSILANRLSWFYDLTGPSISLDTACSSSLMALHLACQSLKTRESDMGLVGGANLLLDPASMIGMANLGMLSPDGISYSFDARANGYARGEGFGIVIVKRLDDALRNGDTIRGIIRATGSNQDGRTPGITQPDGAMQERLIRDTYQNAGLDIGPVRYFEAHGTGTQVGDPTEAKAIATAFKGSRPLGDPLYVGSVKTNIGHLEGASGIAGLIKTILILEKGLIPPNVWFKETNPRILESEWNIKIPAELTPWPARGLRRASVNSFGFGGSNVHVVLDDVFNYLKLHKPKAKVCPLPSAIDIPRNTEAPARFPSAMVEKVSISLELLFVWSAADEVGLKNLLKLYATYLSRAQTLREHQEFLQRLAYTLSSRRSSLRWKSCVVASSLQGLLQTLENDVTEVVRSDNNCKTGFVFTGQGAQWHAMGRELQEISLYRKSLCTSQDILRSLGCTWSLFDELGKDEDATNVNDPAYSQPLCTVLQIALIDLLRSLNIHPSAVIGHSSGEIAAAYSVGALNRESALKVAFYRGFVTAKLANSCSKAGGMVSINLSEKEVRPYLDRTAALFGREDISVGCINSPRNVTISGDVQQLSTLMSLLEQQKVVARKLRVGVAYHSRAMDEVAIEYQTLISDLSMGEPASNGVTMFSSVTGARISIEEVCRAGYWVKNMTNPVRFSEAFSALCLQSSLSSTPKMGAHGKGIAVTDIVEIGPHSALQRPIKDILSSLEHGESIEYNSLLHRNIPAVNSLFTTVGRLHCLGHPVNIATLNDRGQLRSRELLTDLPEYPFNKTQSYWVEGRLSKNFRFRGRPRHELLGTSDPDWNINEARWRHVIRATDNPWILDHKVNGVELYPATGLLVMAIEAARQVVKRPEFITGYKLLDVRFSKALMSIPRANDFETNTFLRPLESTGNKASGSSEFRVYTLTNGDWAENCRGTITLEYEDEINEVDRGSEARMELQLCNRVYATALKTCRTPIEPATLYELLEGMGLSYGDTFRTLDDVRYSDCEAIGRVKLRKWATKVSEREYQDHVIHPTALDGVLQLCFAAVLQGGQVKAPTMVPERIEELWVSAHGLAQPHSDSVRAHAKKTYHNLREARCSVMALDTMTYEPRILVRDLRASTVDSQSITSSSSPAAWKRLCYSVNWQPDVDLLSRQEAQKYCADSMPAEPPPDKFIEEIEFLCYTFMAEALERIENGEMTNIKTQFHRYVQWMKRQSQRYRLGEMVHWQADWPELRRDRGYTQSLISRVEDFSAEGKLYVETGKNLLGILEGTVDALDLLYTGKLAAEYYAEANSAKKGLKAIGPFVDALAHKAPGLRILEIGAGTGSATAFFLQTLRRHGEGERGTPRYARYTFTDISPRFFEEAKEKFGDHSERMVYAPLNIEEDPLQQGFAENDYDLIIAANVLHATSDLAVTLQNVHKLLRPGGKLILSELHNDAVTRAGFTFGLLPGWWRSTEPERQWGPSLSATAWHSVLCANGFSGTDVACSDHVDARNSMTNTMISTALVFLPSPVEIPSVTIVTAGESDSQRSISSQIQAEIASMSDRPCEILDICHLSTEALEKRLCIFLPEVDRSYLRDMSGEQYIQLQSLLRSAQSLLWLTRGGGESPVKPELGMILGLSRVIYSESDSAKVVTLSFPEGTPSSDVAQHTIKVLLDRLHSSPEQCETEYEVRKGKLCISRVVEANYLNDFVHSKLAPQRHTKEAFGNAERALALNIRSPGLLDTMEYVEDIGFEKPLAPDEVEVKVKAVGVNFKDILIALGRLNEGGLGNECAGVVTRVGSEANLVLGDRVCVCALDTYKTYVRSKKSLVFKIPDTVSFCEAASFPVVYTTAYQALCGSAHLSAGESILIHSGAGGTGQAAIQIAKFLKAEIYVTVGSNEKKKLVMDLYAIPEDHIFSSRGLSFIKGIKRMTNGRGVDVILNSLADDSLQGSWDCLAAFGRFVEIGKKDILAGKKLPMLPFNENRAFAAVNLTHMISERPDMICKIMEAILALVDDGQIRAPQPLHVYSNSQIEEAFRYLQSGKNTGKTIVEFKDDDVVPVDISPRPTYSFRHDRTYLVSGGLGGLGRRIARWLIERGAKYLILLSRSGGSSDDARKFVEEFQDIKIATPQCDISDKQALAATLEEYAAKMPPIQGCIQASMVLANSFFEKMSFEAFTAAVKPKVAGSWNLHKLLPNNLDFFVLLSSASGVTGFRSQANYAAGNTYQDSLARHRIMNGQNAVSIDLGMIENIGYVAERPKIRESAKRNGFLPIIDSELLALLDYYCDPNLGMLSPSTCQLITGLEIPTSMSAQGMEHSYWMGRNQFRALHQINNNNSSNDSTNKVNNDLDIAALLSASQSMDEAGLIVTNSLVKKLSRTMSMPEENIDPTKPMHTFGADSLVALEIRNWFAKEMEVDVTVFEILGNESIAELGLEVAGRSRHLLHNEKTN